MGKALQSVIDYSDVIAVTQGLKKIIIEPIESPTVTTEDVFADLERTRGNGVLAKNVTTASIYYETSRSRPGRIDRVNSATGERRTGRFQSGAVRVIG